MSTNSRRLVLTKVRKFRLDPILDSRIEAAASANRVAASDVIRTALLHLLGADMTQPATAMARPPTGIIAADEHGAVASHRVPPTPTVLP